MFKLKVVAFLLSVVCLSVISVYAVFAWTEPTASPPGANVAPPINEGSVAQEKLGPLSATQFGGSLGIGYVNPDGNSLLGGNLSLTGDLVVGPARYIDDDAVMGEINDDWLRLNGYIEMRSNTDNYGIVLRDKDTSSYFGITQVGGYSYLTDSSTYGNYFLRGNGANAMIRGDLAVYGSDIYDTSGPIRLSGEDDVNITMDYNNNDADIRAIIFGKNSMTAPTELMRINESGDVGIGDTTPDAKLDVEGTVGATGYCDELGGNCRTIAQLIAGTGDATPDTIADDGIIQETEIAQNTLDDSEIQDNSLTAASLAANSVGDSELIASPTFSDVNAPYFDVTAGDDYGIRFWNGSANYAITMGDDQADYGWVTDYSIHSNMGTTDNRGFTWGYSDTGVSASLEAETGNLALLGSINANGGISTYDTTVADNTVETGQLCLGNGTNCRTTWPSGASSLWTQSGSDVYRSTGNVGIGTAAIGSYHPDLNNLVIYEASDAGITVANNSGMRGHLNFADGTAGAARYMGRITYMHTGNQMRFMVNGATYNNPSMTIDSNGNIGIGTTAPSAKLDVNGSVEINGNLNMTGNQIQNMRIENRTSDPASPAVGQIWIRTDL